MAEVVTEHAGQQTASSGGIFSDVNGTFNWLLQYWWIILFIIILLIFVAVGIYLIFTWFRDEKRKDQMYVYWERTVEACEISKRGDWIKKKRRWWMLLLGLPLGGLFGLGYLYILLGEHWIFFFAWIGIGFLVWVPFVIWWYKDKSMRVVNVDNMTVGYYRGHCTRQDGYIYLLLTVGKKWLILDDVLCCRFPSYVLTTKTIRRKDNEGIARDVIVKDIFQIDKYVWNERDNYIRVPMTTLVKEDTYFYTPTLLDEKNIPIDFRQKLAGSMHFMTTVAETEKLYSNLGKVTNNAVDSNPRVVEKKKEPDKERDSNTKG